MSQITELSVPLKLHRISDLPSNLLGCCGIRLVSTLMSGTAAVQCPLAYNPAIRGHGRLCVEAPRQDSGAAPCLSASSVSHSLSAPCLPSQTCGHFPLCIPLPDVDSINICTQQELHFSIALFMKNICSFGFLKTPYNRYVC